MTDPLTAIWQRLDRNPPVFFDDQLDPAFAGARDRIFALGLLRSAPASRSAACRECGRGSVGRVRWLANTRTGGQDAYLACPTCGPVPVDPDSLRQWLIDVPALQAAVRDAGQFRGVVTEVAEGHAWHLGSATWCRRRREAYFVRCVHDGTRAGVLAAVSTHPKAVLFFPTEQAAHKWGAATENPVVALESAVGLGPGGFTFDVELVESRLDARSAAVDAEPPPKRAIRTQNIARLTGEVIEHLRRARAHAVATCDLSGEAELLERPTKKKLGELVGLEGYEVTRCFDDESARELNLYWGLALDLEGVMKFQGPVSTGHAGS